MSTLISTRAGLRRILISCSSALAVGLTVVAAPPAAQGTPGPDRAQAERVPAQVHRVHRLASFPPTDGTFAESVATRGSGALIVSTTQWASSPPGSNHGQLFRVRSGGSRSAFGPRLDLGPSGMLLGVAVDRQDRVFLAWWDFMGARPAAIYRVTRHGAYRRAVLPAGTWPNGLAFHHGLLYVSDSAQGDVWRFHPRPGLRQLKSPWLHSRLLTPVTADDIGVNGIAFWRSVLYAVNASRGTLVKVPVGRRGAAGRPTLVAQRQRLLTADGIAFDAAGHLWAAVNGTTTASGPLHGQYLLVLNRRGAVLQATKDAAWMNYPTMVVPGRGPATRDRMFVTDGAFDGGLADLVSFPVG